MTVNVDTYVLPNESNLFLKEVLPMNNPLRITWEVLSDEEKEDLLNWTAFLYFQKGTTLIYAGQEMQDEKCPSLFDIDKVNWNKENDISCFMKKQ